MDGRNTVKLTESSFNVDFLSDDNTKSKSSPVENKSFYKVLIADDEEEVHRMTKLVLKGFEFEGSKLVFLDSYSGAETKRILEVEKDVAVVLLDVVMEEDDSGLKVVRYLRDTLRNSFTRVVLRTGQPGKAPEEKVIIEYEINDYKSKTELSVQKLYSTMYISLRAYKSIRAVNRHKEGLERVINASNDLFRQSSFTGFMNGLLDQVNSLCDFDSESMFLKNENLLMEGVASVQTDEKHMVVAATEKFRHLIGKPIDLNNYPVDIESIARELEEKKEEELLLMRDNHLIICTRSSNGKMNNCVVLEGDINKTNIDFLKIFLSNFTLAIDNFLLNISVRDTQNEIIYRFGEIIENHNNSTGNHVHRVAEITRYLAVKLGFDDQEANALSLASIMHDVGKMGISDSILLKPGKLLPEEFEIMKEHTVRGYNLFKGSKMHLLEMASEIALNHHERYDGKGYPSGKKGGEISRTCEIVAAADVFEALISRRCYKEAWPLNRVIEYFIENKGAQFAPEVVEQLVSNVDGIMEIINRFHD